MYIALIATIVGLALVLAQPGLLLYAVVVAAAMVAFVYGYGSLDRFGLVGKTRFFQTRLQLQL